MRDAQPFLKEVGWRWRSVDDIIEAVAAKCYCSTDEIYNYSKIVLDELRGQKFVECRGDGCVVTSMDEMPDIPLEMQNVHSQRVEGNTPLDDFCARHGIIEDLHIDLTNACTERCLHCYLPRGQKDFLPVEVVDEVLAEFRALNGLTVHLTGGEAMIHPDFERICRKCEELNLNFIIFSNMTCCDEKRVVFLKDVQPQFINVSLYSMNPEEHDAITQLPGSWKKTMEALLACEKAGIHCRIATPLLKINQNAFTELKKFADAHHMHLVPSANIVARSDHGCENLASACSANEMRCVMHANRELFNQYDNVKMPACGAKVCDIGSGRLYLNAQGNYYPCDSMHDYVLGNVRKNTIEEVWKGDKLNYLRGLKNKDYGACATCENRPWCKVCPAANFNATRDLFMPPPGYCEFAKVIREVYGKDR